MASNSILCFILLLYVCVCTVSTGEQEEHQHPNNTPSLESMRQSCLEAHNEKRALHGSPNLTYSDNLNTNAQKWAEYLAKNQLFEHSTNRFGTGESLAKIHMAYKDPGAYVVKMFYDEEEDYDYTNPGFTGATGHFTQLVWKSTTKMGLGVALETNTGVNIFVVQYYVAGNMMGAFKENVLPPAED